jgi:hypothetical protein
MNLDNAHAMRIGILFIFFSLLAILLWTYDVGYVILPLLLVGALIWFVYEYLHKKDKTLLNAAFEIGLFLMIFDFAVENIGAILGLWEVTQSLFKVIYVPIEIMALTLIGGCAWAMAQPKAFNKINSALDILLFSVFGALGEFLLIKNGIMFYSGGWTSIHAFLGYFITWNILHYLRYNIVPLVWK